MESARNGVATTVMPNLNVSGYVNHSGDLAQTLKGQTYFDSVASDDESADEKTIVVGGYVDAHMSSDDLTTDQSSKDDFSLTPTASSSSVVTNSYADNLSSVSSLQPADQYADEGT
jgi:hypothetical protein